MTDKELTFNFDVQRFQSFVEKNDDYLGSEEIREYYDGQKNIAVAIQVFEGVSTKSYLYGGIDELLIVKKGDLGLEECTAKKLSDFWSFTPFYLFEIDGVKHIVSGLNFMLKMKAKLTYTGTNVVRGMPVDDWQLCYFNEERNSTQLLTLSITDEKWQPAEKSEYKSIPVQVTIRTKANHKFNETMTTDSITEFKPYLLLEEEDYFPPAGTFCTDRKNMKELPGVPKYFEFFLEGAISGISHGINGTITKTREFYDFEAKLFKMQYFKGTQPTVDVHDFMTGLVYSIDEASGNCTVSQIDPNGIDATADKDGFTNIRNPEKFFDYEGFDWQFSAQRRINGVNTGNWIGKGMFQNIPSIIEWSFLTGYNRTDDLNTYAPTPVRFTVTFLAGSGSQILPIPNVYNFVNFRISDSIAAHHDISQCESPRDTKTFQISFETSQENVVLAQNHADEFKLGAYRAVHRSAKVTRIRLQRFKILFSGDHIFIVFDVMEKSRFYGNVQIPQNDVSLEDAEYHLGDSVSKSALIVDFEYSDSEGRAEKLQFTANPQSFSKIENQYDGYTILQTVTNPKGISGTTVGIASTMVAITALVIVFVLVVLHKNDKITLPGLPK